MPSSPDAPLQTAGKDLGPASVAVAGSLPVPCRLVTLSAGYLVGWLPCRLVTLSAGHKTKTHRLIEMV